MCRMVSRASRDRGLARSPRRVRWRVSRLAAVGLLDKHGEPATCYFPGDPITVAIELELTRRVELPYFLVSIAGAFGPIAAASMFHDGCRPPFIDGRYRIECTFEKLILAPKQRFTVRFALYAADGHDDSLSQAGHCELRHRRFGGGLRVLSRTRGRANCWRATSVGRLQLEDARRHREGLGI